MFLLEALSSRKLWHLQRANILCLLSFRDHCHLWPHVQCLENHCLFCMGFWFWFFFGWLRGEEKSSLCYSISTGTPSVFFFFSFFFLSFLWPCLQHPEVPRSNWSCSCRPTPQPQQGWIQAASTNYAAACGSTQFLTHGTRPGIEPTFSQTLCQVLNLLSHNGNSVFQF